MIIFYLRFVIRECLKYVQTNTATHTKKNTATQTQPHTHKPIGFEPYREQHRIHRMV